MLHTTHRFTITLLQALWPRSLGTPGLCLYFCPPSDLLCKQIKVARCLAASFTFKMNLHKPLFLHQRPHGNHDNQTEEAPELHGIPPQAAVEVLIDVPGRGGSWPASFGIFLLRLRLQCYQWEHII